MESKDHVFEMAQVAQSCGLGLFDTSILMEGFSASFSGNGSGRVVNRPRQNTGLNGSSIDELVNRVMANNAAQGIHASREEVEAAVRKNPGKYSRNAFKKLPTAADMRNDLSLTIPSPEEARKAYYSAAVDTLYRLYKRYDIPFDAARCLDEIMSDDTYGHHSDFDRTGGTPKFADCNDMLGNDIIKRLSRENTVLNHALGDARKFIAGVNKATEAGHGALGMYLEDVRSNYERIAAEAEAKYSAKRVVPEPDEPEVEETAPFMYICDFAKRYKRLKYPAIYRRFADVASPDELAAAPKPDEKLYDYMVRVQLPPHELETTFSVKLNRMLAMVYTPEEMQNLYMQVQSSPDRDISDFFSLAKSTAEENENIKPENRKMYTVWKCFRELDAVCMRMNHRPFFRRDG